MSCFILQHNFHHLFRIRIKNEGVHIIRHNVRAKRLKGIHFVATLPRKIAKQGPPTGKRIGKTNTGV